MKWVHRHCNSCSNDNNVLPMHRWKKGRKSRIFSIKFILSRDMPELAKIWATPSRFITTSTPQHIRLPLNTTNLLGYWYKETTTHIDSRRLRCFSSASKEGGHSLILRLGRYPTKSKMSIKTPNKSPHQSPPYNIHIRKRILHMFRHLHFTQSTSTQGQSCDHFET